MRRSRPTPQQEFFPGFTEVVEIGVGSLSTVYRAREIGTNRLVALKLLNVRDASPRALESFERESIALGAVSSHPNIVTLYRSFRAADERPVLVLELCRGSVGDRMHAEAGLPVSEVVALGIKIAGALETAHRAGILHRDVKPQNILLTEFGEPALADFGVAMLQSSTQTTAGLFDFTTLHAAPELLEGGDTSAATDVYELASTLYQLIAGRAAFRAYDGESPASVILRILRDPVQPLVNTQAPSALSDLLLYAMSKDKSSRPPTAAEFAGELATVEIGQQWPRTQFLIRDASGATTGLPTISRLPEVGRHAAAAWAPPPTGQPPAGPPPAVAAPDPGPVADDGWSEVSIVQLPSAQAPDEPENETPETEAAPEPDLASIWAEVAELPPPEPLPQPLDPPVLAAPPPDPATRIDGPAPEPEFDAAATPLETAIEPDQPPVAELSQQPEEETPLPFVPWRGTVPEPDPFDTGEHHFDPAAMAERGPAAPAQAGPAEAGPPAADGRPAQYPIPPSGMPDDVPVDAGPGTVPTWAFRAATQPQAGPATYGALDPMSLSSGVTLRAGTASMVVDDSGLSMRVRMRKSSIPWHEILGFEPLVDEDGRAARLVVLTRPGPVELAATRRPAAEVHYIQALLEAYWQRAAMLGRR